MQRLSLASLRNRRFAFDGLFLLNVLKGTLNCESLLHDIGLKPRTRNIRYHNIFYLSKQSYFLRCFKSANSLCNHFDIFNLNKISIATFTKIKFNRARWLRGNARDSHSGGPGFKSRGRPTWVRFLVVSSI